MRSSSFLASGSFAIDVLCRQEEYLVSLSRKLREIHHIPSTSSRMRREAATLSIKPFMSCLCVGCVCAWAWAVNNTHARLCFYNLRWGRGSGSSKCHKELMSLSLPSLSLSAPLPCLLLCTHPVRQHACARSDMRNFHVTSSCCSPLPPPPAPLLPACVSGKLHDNNNTTSVFFGGAAAAAPQSAMKNV